MVSRRPARPATAKADPPGHAAMLLAEPRSFRE
jgi:hypothetical protein